MRLIYTPRFFKPDKAEQWYSPDIAAAMQEGITFGIEHKLKSAAQLIREEVARLIMMTDLQNDFRDEGRLGVKGTNGVVLRVCTRIINGIAEDFYGGIMFSLDGHPFRHLSYDYMWEDENGTPLDLSGFGRAAILTLEDPANGIFEAVAFGASGPYTIGHYKSRIDPMDMVAYWYHLQRTGQGPIWVFTPHCLIGTDGASLHPLLAETIAFACGARSIQPSIIHKGAPSNTDSFGPLEPCRPDPTQPQGRFQKWAIDEMRRFRSVEFAGVAQDFCDYYMKLQTMKALENTEYMRSLRFISDGTVPIVPNAQHVQKLNAEAIEAGVRFIQHDTLLRES